MLLLLISFSAADATALRVCDCCNRLSIVCILLGPLLESGLDVLSPYAPLLLDGRCSCCCLMMMMILYSRAHMLSCLLHFTARPFAWLNHINNVVAVIDVILLLPAVAAQNTECDLINRLIDLRNN